MDHGNCPYRSATFAGDELRNTHRVQASKVWPKEDGSPTPAYRMLDLYFADYEAASKAAAEAGPLVGATFEHATGGVTIRVRGDPRRRLSRRGLGLQRGQGQP